LQPTRSRVERVNGNPADNGERQMSRLKNGAFVLEAFYSSLTERRTVLAEWKQNTHHPYVTWRLDENGNAYLGHYFSTLDAATEDFNQRIK